MSQPHPPDKFDTFTRGCTGCGCLIMCILFLLGFCGFFGALFTH